MSQKPILSNIISWTMGLRLVVIAILSMVFCNPLFSQTDFEYRLSSRKGNKIVLLGEWKAEDSGKWKEITDSDAIFGHGFTILNSNDLGIRMWSGGYQETFENWFRSRYSLTSSARWVVLDLTNKLVVSGIQVPSTNAFDKMLEEHGIKTPIRQVRDFLRENPDHLDAMTDLLNEARRRALHVMPPDPKEDLEDESDLRTWAVMASETDRVFKGSWLGADIRFFRPDQEQPERFSKLMRNVFRKHISKVESAIVLYPLNNTLWNIWAWMAGSMPDYKWETFINSFEPTVFNAGFGGSQSIPSDEVCVWIVDHAKKKKDWNTVVIFAKVAKLCAMREKDSKREWTPGSGFGWVTSERYKGFPFESAYAPLLEGLLRLGNVEGANRVYDEVIRSLDKGFEYSREGKSTKADSAAIARLVGMEDLAKIWEKGELLNNAPSVLGHFSIGSPSIGIIDVGSAGTLWQMFEKIVRTYPLRLSSVPSDSLASLGWDKEAVDRWALIGEDGLVLAQDTSVPDLDILQNIFRKFNISSKAQLAKKYQEEHGNSPGIELKVATDSFMVNAKDKQYAPPTDENQDEEMWGETTRLFGRTIREYPLAMLDVPSIYISNFSAHSPLLKSISKAILSNIESLLERKPSSETLWNHWFIWNNIEDANRQIESIIGRIKLSPLSIAGTVPPASVIGQYYEECKKNGNWPKVIGLLKTAWDRDYDRISNADSQFLVRTKDNIGDILGIHLIEAYLQDDKPREASEIFDAVLDCGGNFKDISKIVELAKEKGYEKLATEWESKTKK